MVFIKSFLQFTLSIYAIPEFFVYFFFTDPLYCFLVLFLFLSIIFVMSLLTLAP